MTDTSYLFRALPSVDVLLKELASQPDIKATHLGAGNATDVADVYNINGLSLPRTILRELINSYLQKCRDHIKSGQISQAAELKLATLLPELKAYLADQGRPHFRRTINATGVVIHTNLGRSILAKAAAEAVYEACLHYSNLEFDLNTGERGSRYSHVEALLCALTGAEAALVVNNNAAAVLLVLDTLCKNREVIVSRGQLVEIGGSFRIPEVMSKSGCILKEVGSTNRSHLADYSSAINQNTAALMRVHTSNYRIIGFHSEVALPALAELGKKHNLPVIEDLGSGNLCDFAVAGLPMLAQDEPTVQKTVADGADIVTFSGDKVLGGPQAGIIVGKAEYINKIKKNQLNRALRIDKMTLAALEATLRIYKEPELALKQVPTLAMICTPAAELKTRAGKLAKLLKNSLTNKAVVTLQAGASLVGGGSFPERLLPTTLVYIEVKCMPISNLRQALLSASTPVVARLEDNKLCFDVRTITDSEFILIERSILEVLPH